MGNTEKKLWRIEEIDESWEFGGDGVIYETPNIMEIGIIEATEEEIKELIDKPWNKALPVGQYCDVFRPFEATEIEVTHSISEMKDAIDARRECNRLCGYGTGN